MTIRHNCKERGCYVRCVLPDWAMLDGCFGDTNVKPSDVDGQVHQNGNFLNLEMKSSRGFISPPLMRSIDARVKRGDGYIVIWGDAADGSDISHMRVFGIQGYESGARVPATLADVRVAASKWWDTVYQPGRV